MKRLVIEGALVAVLAFCLAACERSAISAERHSATVDKGHDAEPHAGQMAETREKRDGSSGQSAPAPFQMPTTGSGGTGGSGGTYGTGGTGGSGATGGSGGTYGSGGTGATGGTFGPAGYGGLGGTFR